MYLKLVLIVLVAVCQVNADVNYAVVPGAAGAYSAASGAGVGQLLSQTGEKEDHNKLNVGLNISKDTGSSSKFSNTAAQVGVAGAAATGAYQQTPGAVYQQQYQQPQPYPVPTPYYNGGGWGQSAVPVVQPAVVPRPGLPNPYPAYYNGGWGNPVYTSQVPVAAPPSVGLPSPFPAPTPVRPGMVDPNVYGGWGVNPPAPVPVTTVRPGPVPTPGWGR